MLLIGIISLYLGSTALWLVHSQASARNLSALSFEELLSSLEPVTRSKSTDSLVEGSPSLKAINRRGPGSPQIEAGKRNLKRVTHNARILIALATYCNNWSPGSCAETVRAMRAHQMKLRKAAIKHDAIVFLHIRSAVFGGHVSEISSEYCAIVDCLLALYKAIHIGRYDQLRAACN